MSLFFFSLFFLSLSVFAFKEIFTPFFERVSLIRRFLSDPLTNERPRSIALCPDIFSISSTERDCFFFVVCFLFFKAIALSETHQVWARLVKVFGLHSWKWHTLLTRSAEHSSSLSWGCGGRLIPTISLRQTVWCWLFHLVALSLFCLTAYHHVDAIQRYSWLLIDINQGCATHPET